MIAVENLNLHSISAKFDLHLISGNGKLYTYRIRKK